MPAAEVRVRRMRRRATEWRRIECPDRGLDGGRRRPPCLGRIHDGSDSGTDLAGARTGGFRLCPAIRMVVLRCDNARRFSALAGYAAAAVFESKGTRGYAASIASAGSACRFSAALPAVLIPTVLIWMLGLYLAGRCEVSELLALTSPTVRSRPIGSARPISGSWPT